MEASLDRLTEVVNELVGTVKSLENKVGEISDSVKTINGTLEALRTTTEVQNKKIADLEDSNLLLRADLDRLRLEFEKSKTVSVVEPTLTQSQNESVSPPATATESKVLLLEKLRAGAEVLYLSDSNGRDVPYPVLGRRCGRFIFKETPFTLEAIPSLVIDHPASPSIVVISCFMNTIEMYSDDNTCPDRVSAVQSLYANAVKSIHERWPTCKIIAENSPWILSPSTNLRREDTTWSDGLVLDITEPHEVSVAYTKWDSNVVLIDGRNTIPKTVYKDTKHLGDTGIQIRLNTLIKTLLSYGVGDFSRLRSLGNVFSQLRQIRDARVPQQPRRNFIREQSQQQVPNLADFPTIDRVFGHEQRRHRGPAPYHFQPPVSSNAQHVDVAQILQIYEVLRTQKPGGPLFQEGGYAQGRA
jgi:hypothetical protein